MSQVGESSGNSRQVDVYKKAMMLPKGSWTLKELGIELKKYKLSTSNRKTGK